MRLHRLQLRAFGPFAAEQHVDFDRLASSGLFLLDGPTGAGKSTVLDAITFALYGPGERGGDDRLHSHFAAPGTAPEVVLEFSVAGARHRVTRTPEHLRPKKTGTGLTRQAASAHLERWEGGGWVSRSSNKAEVGELLAETVGLTRAQFTQVVLLPQGEFARFLQADDDERRALLTKLFGTHLFQQITDELAQRSTELNRDVAAARVDLAAAVAAAGEAAGLADADAAALRELAPDGLAALLAEIAAGLDAEHRQAGEAADAARDAASTARTEHTAAAERAARLDGLVAALTAAAEHESGRAAHLARAERLADAHRAEPVRPLLTALAGAERAREQAHGELLALAPQPEPDWSAGVGADALVDRAARSARLAAELQHLVEREAAEPVLAAAVTAAEAELAAAAGELQRVERCRAQLPAEAERTETCYQVARAAAERLPGLRREQETARQRLAAARTAADLEPQLAAATEARVRAIDAHQVAAAEHLRLVESRLAGMAAELAGALEPGEPCAVCGAVEHPAPARPGPDAVTGGQVDEAARRREQAQRARDAAEAELQRLQQGVAAARALAGDATVEALAAQLAELQQGAAEADAAAARLDELNSRRAAVTHDADRLAGEHTAATTAQATAEQRLAAARREHAVLVAELTEAAAGCASVAVRQGQLRREDERLRALAAAVTALAAADARLADARAQAAREATECGFGDLATARAAVLDATTRASLDAEVETWAGTADRLARAVEAARADVPAAPGEDVESAVAAAHAEAASRAGGLAAAEAAARVAGDRAERARHAVQRFAGRRAELDRVASELATLSAAAAPVGYLAKLTRGMTGQRRVALTTYVLRHWFERVVQAANLRLASMSTGRYELVRVDEVPGSRSQRTGLTLQVLDRHTGERRSTHSLSGGETFYTSLALALGLADVVKAEAGGVDLDTLFIDEGFGSLDPDTLEEVMSVIDELRDRGRVVGIVSHVADLKDRIAERVEVRRRADGSSELRVVA